jgi:hypothetical protein
MSGWCALTKLCLAGSISLALAAPALGAPAGKEYLPRVPEAAGEEVVEGTGLGSTILAPKVRGSDAAADGSGSGSGSGSGNGSGGEGATPVAQISSSEEESSGALDTLLDPVVLVLIAGVAAAAVGMMLRRRQALEGDGHADRASGKPRP